MWATRSSLALGSGVAAASMQDKPTSGPTRRVRASANDCEPEYASCMLPHEAKVRVTEPALATLTSPERNAVPKRPPDPVTSGTVTLRAPMGRSALPTSHVALPSDV